VTEVLVLTDGVPGHDRSSEGVIAALSRLRPVRARWLGVAEVRPRSRRLARVCATFAPPERFLAARVRLAPERVAPAFRPGLEAWPERADVVVSTGPATAAANIAAARRLSARSLYCGFPKWPVTGFSLILSPVPSRSRRVVVTPRPTSVDGEALPAPRPLATPGDRTIALLFGGDTKHHSYTLAEVDTLATRLSAVLAARTTWSLLAFDSRRTEPRLFDRLQNAMAPFGERVRMHRYQDGGMASNAAAFQADLVIVTADSLSMTTEALASSRPTLVAAADSYIGPARDRAEFESLARAGRIGRITFGALDPAALEATPMPPRQSQPESLARLLSSHGF